MKDPGMVLRAVVFILLVTLMVLVGGVRMLEWLAWHGRG